MPATRATPKKPRRAVAWSSDVNSFWGGFSERSSGSGRNATLFIFVILLMGGATIFSLCDYFHISQTTINVLEVSLCLLVTTTILRTLRQSRARRRDRYSIQPLSARELTTARDKLKKQR